MTTYRLFPSTNGPASPTSYTGNFIAGVNFAVNGGGNWFQGYYIWCCSGAPAQPTGSTKCCLWAVGGNNGFNTGGVPFVVPGSVVTASSLTPGQWNYIPLPTPIQLTPGYSPQTSVGNNCSYIAAIAINGNFPDTGSFWTAPIDQGPLHAFAGPNSTPFNIPQGVFSTASNDPTTAMPGQSSGTDNFWVDVQISTVGPTGYAGTYRLYPNQAMANTVTTGDAAWNYTVSTEINITSGVALNNMWFFSPGSATTLPTRCDVWNINTGLSVASITSPAWQNAAGSAYTAGSVTNGAWIKAAFANNTTLPIGNYRVSVYNSSGHLDANWSPKDASTDFWNAQQTGTGGIGYQGITWGPLSAPNWAGSHSGYNYNGAGAGNTPPYSGGTVAHAQPPFGLDASGPGSAVAFPQLWAGVGTGSTQSQNYWVDIEVTSLTFAISVSDVAAETDSFLVIANIPVSDAAGLVEAEQIPVEGITILEMAAMVETLSITVTTAATDTAAAGDLFYHAGLINLSLPVLVLMAEAYQGYA